MEKDLLDLSGEDEDDYWLLKNTPKKGVTSFPDSSRLQIPRSTRPPFSPIGRVNNGMEEASLSVDMENVGKENTIGNRFEVPKLSVERQQMKKKKKTAGFNLRKSLAWDRAFSTEEGVLDPVELSKVTGDGELLPAIQEEYRESMSASKCNGSVSPGLQALEENLFSDLPVNSKNRGKKIMSGGVLPKYTSSPSKGQSSTAQKKVISSLDLRSGSKRSGCPRPPPSSSMKRPANVHTKKPPNKELTASKVSTTKSDVLTVGNNMKKTTQSPIKVKQQNHPTQSKNSQRSIGSISFSKSTSSTKGKTKSSLASNSSIPKPSLKQVRRNVISKASEIPSASNLQHAAIGKSCVGPMNASDVPMPDHAEHDTNSNAISMGTLLTQSYCSRVGNTQSAVSRLGKPSGLRAPSPSIGYFSQADSQSSQSAGNKHRQLNRSDVCSASRVSSIPALKKPHVAESIPGGNFKAAARNTGSSGFSAQSILFKFSQEISKADLKSAEEVESKVSCSSPSSQINEILQHPCTSQSDTGKLVLDGVTTGMSKKVSTGKSEFQSNSKLSPSGCKSTVEEGNICDDNKDEKRKSCCSEEECCASPMKHGPLFKNSMDSPMQGRSSGEFNNCSQLKVSNPGEEDICTTNTEDFDTLDVHGPSLNESVRFGNEGESSPCLSNEKKDVLLVYKSNESLAKQPEVLDSFTAETAVGNIASTKSDLDDGSSENQLGSTDSVFVLLRRVEAPDSYQSPCKHLEENATSSSILCDHNKECDGQAALNTEKIIEASDSTETNCEAESIRPVPDCKDWLRESESCQSVLEDTQKRDVLTGKEREDQDDGPDMQIDNLTGSPDVEQNMEQAKLLIPSSPEVRMEDKPLEPSHELFSEKQASEKYTQYDGSSVPNTSDLMVDQLGKSDGCSPAKDVLGGVFSCEQVEDNSDLEDMDLVTVSDCSDEEPEGTVELKEVDLTTESELTSDVDEFSVKGILNQEYLETKTILTASDMCGETKTPLNESVSSSASLYGDPEHLNDGDAKIQTDTENAFDVHVPDQELSPHEEELQVVKISPSPAPFATREEESRTPISINEAFLVRDDMQPNESNVPSDDILISQSTSSGTCASEGKNKSIIDTKKPDPIIVKPPDAIPFSDEWLAAIEAAGEEILTQKSGRVQHSPTDKSVPEPGPWSPVKKKNNQGVGPFDCTKYTNKGLLLPPALD